MLPTRQFLVVPINVAVGRAIYGGTKGSIQPAVEDLPGAERDVVGKLWVTRELRFGARFDQGDGTRVAITTGRYVGGDVVGRIGEYTVRVIELDSCERKTRPASSDVEC